MSLQSKYNAATSVVDWAKSDAYHNSFLIHKDDDLDFAVKNATAQGLPDIAVSPAQGKWLSLMAQSIGAKRILEVGTLGGYSSIWMGKTLPEDGELITLEINGTHAKVARENFAKAGLAAKCKVVVGPAYESMTGLQPDVPFDLVFIDADKRSYPQYVAEAKRLVRKGGVIIVDNVVRYGLVNDLSVDDIDIVGIREMLAYIKEDKELDATTIATVGERAFDGFLYAIRK
ncbi:O-methyltransferase family 3 protein [Lentinula raphanica]|uniref:O-methyltransferase family 3 protein n=1 Tax=Lentinula raphanica TaxID=153919 RepID=A0AA38UAJ6_9AGAR|nr:O-methyltransferase family 3 protein [Lentinula raphanica]KAJ3834990.1 O-methyltransferase family 3 protein [Lentinula raphanica]KAJ3970702.1 O-methyltransferase family 3 protein [Lentinula raphanica]